MKAGKYIIYKATNLINGKCYVGKTITSLQKRKRGHFYDIKRTTVYFHNAIKKYGWENFEWEVIFECDNELILNVMETFKIMVNHTHKTEGGYNLTWGGSGGGPLLEETKEKIGFTLKDGYNTGRLKHPRGMKGKHHTKETKEKISAKECGSNHWNYGNHWDDDTKRKNSETQKGRKMTEEQKQRISQSTKGTKNHMYGKHISDVSKEKMRKAKIGIYNGKNNPNSKTYKILNLMTNEIIVVDCLKEWCCKNNILYDSIRVCVDKRPYKKIFLIENVEVTNNEKSKK